MTVLPRTARGAALAAGLALFLAVIGTEVAAQGTPAASAPPGAPPVLGSAPAAVPSAADPVAAGHYLADAAHCAACHTSRADRPYAGNLEIGSKFGVMYSSNITPDPTYGIGSWSEAEFSASLREGRGRHGTYLYPSMPYVYFTKISDADVHALWAYFRTVKPIAEATRKERMKFPFNLRTGIAAWQAIFLKKGRYVDDATQSAQWNRGAYLVDGLGHCGACHTPKNIAMADRKGRPLQGAELDHWFAPNISGGRYSGIADWSQAQLVAYLKSGHNDKNVAAVGPMLQTIAQGTAKLVDADLQAIAVYLKNQPAGSEAGPAKADSAWNADRRAAGGNIYATNCVQCHGADGKGVDGVAPALAGNSSVASKGPDTVVRSVIQGFAPQGRWGVMPSFNEVLESQEIADVANYVRTAWGSTGPANASPSLVNKMRFDGVQAEAGVSAALICPSAPIELLDAATLREVASLGKAGDADRAAAGRLVRSFRSRHPGIDSSQTITTLAGAWCRDVMAQAPGSVAGKQQRFVAFMARLSEASASAR